MSPYVSFLAQTVIITAATSIHAANVTVLDLKRKKKKTDLFLQFKHIDSNSSRELICSEEKIKWFLKIHIFMQK